MEKEFLIIFDTINREAGKSEIKYITSLHESEQEAFSFFLKNNPASPVIAIREIPRGECIYLEKYDAGETLEKLGFIRQTETEKVWPDAFQVFKKQVDGFVAVIVFNKDESWYAYAVKNNYELYALTATAKTTKAVYLKLREFGWVD